MNLSDVMSLALKNVPKAVAAGLVDMESGMFLYIKTTANQPQKAFDLFLPVFVLLLIVA